MESKQLKFLLNEIGGIVHSMNTIVVSLSVMNDTDITVPSGLDISWKPNDLPKSKIRARTYACKSAYVYVAENLFGYLSDISKDPLWVYTDTSFEDKNKNDKKSDRVASFLEHIPTIDKEMVALSVLLCHWRNRIVHGESSRARLTKSQIGLLTDKDEEIYNSYHHFSPLQAIQNFDNKKVTLKDVSTLSTIVIKCCRAIDRHYLNGIQRMTLSEIYQKLLTECPEFNRIYTQSESKKRERQINTWIKMHYPCLIDCQKEDDAIF